MTEQIVLTDFTFTWNLEKILVRVGSKGGISSARPAVLELMDDVRREIGRLARPRAVYTVIPFAETNGHPIFAQAVSVALGVLTIGPELEEECARAFAAGDALRGLILDGFGTEAVTQVFRRCEREIVADGLGRGLWPSRRFSPGYKGWPLVEQRFVFDKVDAARIGVRLNEAWMMIPRKSNSFRINFYADRALSTRRSFAI